MHNNSHHNGTVSILSVMYAEYRNEDNFILNVIMLSIILLNVGVSPEGRL